jgi:hypothetical protein
MLRKDRQEWHSDQTTVTDTKMIEAMKGFHMCDDGVIAVESSTAVSLLVIKAFVLLALPAFSRILFHPYMLSNDS